MGGSDSEGKLSVSNDWFWEDNVVCEIGSRNCCSWYFCNCSSFSWVSGFKSSFLRTFLIAGRIHSKFKYYIVNY